MVLALPAMVIIACPRCGTRYQLERAALGEARMVQCASCSHEWEARPEEPPRSAPAEPAEPDVIFDGPTEEALDAAFSAEAVAAATEGTHGELPIADIRRAIAPRTRVDTESARRVEEAMLHRHRQAFDRRQETMLRQLPMVRLRGYARIALVAVLVALVAGGLLWRKSVVEQFPDLAGLYAAIGLPVNVVGLEFADIQTLEALRDGVLVLTVSGRIVQVSDRTVPVPAIVVTLVGTGGGSLYEWSVAPQARELMPGEALTFETRLTQPPTGADRVRLSFANARARPVAAAAMPAPQAQPQPTSAGVTH